MDADLLLGWMSETGAGDVPDLRRRITWLAQTADLNPGRYETGRWLRDVSSLGHAEIDWVSGRWAVSQSVAALLPACGGTGVLCGSRPLDLVERFTAHDAVFVQVEAQGGHRNGHLPTPSTVYFQADSVALLETACAEVGLRYVGCAGRHIANALPPLQLGQPAAPPAWDAQVEYLTEQENVSFRRGLPDGDVLCRLTVQGRPTYLYRSGHDWFHTDHAHGVLWALAERRVGVFRWRPERIEGADELGTAFVDQGAPLPPLQARALVLCSGLPTQFGESARTAIYRNVPKILAAQVASSVRQRLSVID